MSENTQIDGGTKTTNKTTANKAASKAAAIKNAKIIKQNAARTARAAKRELFMYEGQIVKKDRYWELVKEEGFEILAEDGSIAKFTDELLANPVTPTLWEQFYTEYIKYIQNTISKNGFKTHGLDLDAKVIQKKYHVSITQDEIDIYKIVFDEIKTIFDGTFSLCNISKDALKHLLESIDKQPNTFYSQLITIVELMFDYRVFNLFMTNKPNGTKLSEKQFAGIWLRKGPIWGIGEKTFCFGGLRNLIQNYFRKLIRYAIKYGNTFRIININPHRRNNQELNSKLGGESLSLSEVKIDSKFIQKLISIEIQNEFNKIINKNTTIKKIKIDDIVISVKLFKDIDLTSSKINSAPSRINLTSSKNILTPFKRESATF